jgi:conjugal transfer pilus assembly protein TraV
MSFIKIIILCIQICLISACGTMNSKFDCPNQAGVNCKSLDQINRMVDSGQISSHIQTANSQIRINESDNTHEFQSFPVRSIYIPGQPLRYGETVQRIWIAPYEDKDSNYHQANIVYSIMKGGHWIGQPLKTDDSF